MALQIVHHYQPPRGSRVCSLQSEAAKIREGSYTFCSQQRWAEMSIIIIIHPLLKGFRRKTAQRSYTETLEPGKAERYKGFTQPILLRHAKL